MNKKYKYDQWKILVNFSRKKNAKTKSKYKQDTKIKSKYKEK